MGLVETEGLVLRKYNLADADKIVVILTEKHGLIRGVANGAKRLKSKFSSSLEFFSRIHLSYLQKEERELVIIRDTDLIASVFGRLSNPEFYEAFAEVADLLIKFTPPNEPNKRLYHMTRYCLEAASSNASRIPGIRAYFEIWLLKLGGFLPSWEKCRTCSRTFDEKEDSRLHLDFQLQCAGCGSGLSSVGPGVRRLFLLAQHTSPAKFSERTGEHDENLTSLLGILKSLTDAVLERSPAISSDFRNSKTA